MSDSWFVNSIYFLGKQFYNRLNISGVYNLYLVIQYPAIVGRFFLLEKLLYQPLQEHLSSF